MTTKTDLATKGHTEGPRADIVQVDKALESWRDSGFDLPTAVGEPVDNSIEAKATTVRIHTDFAKDQSHKKIARIAFADNGTGISPNILPNVLSLGFSTRYNAREGLGRFGVGLKLAALSHARRIEVYTRPRGDSRYYRTVLDLDKVAAHTQAYIEAAEVDGYPKDLAELMRDDEGKEFSSGTLVVWSNVDRLVGGGRFGTSLEEKLHDLTKFLARAYRKFIDQGLRIELNGREIIMHDPLFLLDNPRIAKRYDDLRGKIIDEDFINLDGHEVRVVVTLCPEEFRPRSGEGGERDREGRDIRPFHIPDNEGKLSIIRNGREIYYDIVPKLLPAGVQRVDRYIGIEVSFPATLDEYFQVRHVKRGAEPVSKLREELRNWFARPVKAARKEIRDFWNQVEHEERKVASEHERTTAAVRVAEQTSPRGRAGLDLRPEEVQQKLEDLLTDLAVDPGVEPYKAEKIKRQVDELPITLVDGDWPGKELFEITHLNGKAIVNFNHRHPFFREIYDPIKELAGTDLSEVDSGEVTRKVRLVDAALDVLFMAYAKAENMHEDPEIAYSDLRADWGKFTYAYVREILKDAHME